jgi:hypothetical protein
VYKCRCEISNIKLVRKEKKRKEKKRKEKKRKWLFKLPMPEKL